MLSVLSKIILIGIARTLHYWRYGGQENDEGLEVEGERNGGKIHNTDRKKEEITEDQKRKCWGKIEEKAKW